MSKADVQARARELGLSDDGTEGEIQDRIDAHEADAGDGVASASSNAELEHSQGGTTTRDDLHDVGVPMLQGEAREPSGPEDALGAGEKRGDYRDRVDALAHTAVPLEGGGEAIRDDDGNIVDYKPRSEIVAQAPRADEIGKAGALKGGVETDPASVAGDAVERAAL